MLIGFIALPGRADAATVSVDVSCTVTNDSGTAITIPGPPVPGDQIQLTAASGCTLTATANPSGGLTGSNPYRVNNSTSGVVTITATWSNPTGSPTTGTTYYSFNASPVPDAPTINSVVPGNLPTTLVVTYTQNPDNGVTITRYEYQVDSGGWTTAASPFTISGLTSGTSYSITVRKVFAGSSYATSTPVSGTPGTQTITYAQPAGQELATGSLTVAPTASSGEAVTLASSTPSVCTVSGSTISFLAAGTCTTTASQAGTGVDGWQPASDVTRSFVISTTPAPAPEPAATTPAPERKVTLCHRTRSYSNPYVTITVDQSSVLTEGHGSHTGGLYPAAGWGDIIPPFEGYAGLNWPAGQQILDSGCDAGKATGKITLCHATSSTTNPYVLITVDRNSILRKGHGSHTGGLYPEPKWGDIIPAFNAYPGLNWTAGQQILDDGCSPFGPVTDPDPDPIPEQPLCLADPGTDAPTSLNRDDITITPGNRPGRVDITDKNGDPLTLVSTESTDPTGGVDVVSSGADLNKPAVWQSLGYGDVCWKLEPFGDTDLQYTLPNPIQLPAGLTGADWTYSNVIVKAGSVTSSDSTLQPNTIFGAPAPGDVVWPDVNANGVFDPGGQGKDKAISHIIICATQGAQAASATPSATATATATATPTEETSEEPDTCSIPTTPPTSPSTPPTSPSTPPTSPSTPPTSPSTPPTSPSTPSILPTEPTRPTRPIVIAVPAEANVRADELVSFTVAQGASVLTFDVPMKELQVYAAQAGTIAAEDPEQDLADTGSDQRGVMAAVLLAGVLALLLVPAGLRRRRR